MTAGKEARRLLHGIVRKGGLSAVGSYVGPQRFGHRPLRAWSGLRGLFADRSGIELGGPSALFDSAGPLPIYAAARHVDLVDFSRNTLWRKTESPGEFRSLEGRAGSLLIGEATDLSSVPSNSYDFLLASHVLEHIANPIRALREFRRVLHPAGPLVLVVPHRDWTFDRRRPLTTISHLDRDFEQGTGEDDTSHFEEILRLHDTSLDEREVNHETLSRRLQDNLKIRSAHHHVFDLDSVNDLLRHEGLTVVYSSLCLPFHAISIATGAQAPL